MILGDDIHDLKTVLTKIAIPILIITGLIFTENLSTAVILLTACIVLLIVGRVKLTHIFAIAGLGLVLLGFYIAYDAAKTNISNNKAKKEMTAMFEEGSAAEVEFTPRKNSQCFFGISRHVERDFRRLICHFGQ